MTSPYSIEPVSARGGNGFTDMLVTAIKAYAIFYGVMLVIVLLVLYCMYHMVAGFRAGRESKDGFAMWDRLASTQAHFSQDDRPGHEGTRTDVAAGGAFDTRTDPAYTDMGVSRGPTPEAMHWDTKSAGTWDWSDTADSPGALSSLGLPVGVQTPSQGPSTSAFMDFARNDQLMDAEHTAVMPSHEPETSDATLERIIRQE